MRLLLALLLATSSLCLTMASYAADKTVIAVIVANDNPIKSIAVGELKLIYWRKKTYWSHGQRIHPINLPPDNPVRLHFSTSILGSLPNTQSDYWNGLYFHGVSPPHVLYSDEAAIRYVQETAGSIAYVDACKLDTRVKAVLWILPNGETSTDAAAIKCN
ncbi:hypothetical protein [Methylotenera mobilis]|uniref:Uncharacterized protein n=1 Tax=Methylotenera mobilis (strain JLW8 / ATCC BAA-1282 / DSM 17540) TaxID=583345 RepID=C6WY56_METML|nr:hypothetical protein [Methylotenera mobilis]ACT46952.1 hypothetical protein Mmol_0041 [Methylotenera mobilis JLW8]